MDGIITPKEMRKKNLEIAHALGWTQGTHLKWWKDEHGDIVKSAGAGTPCFVGPCAKWELMQYGFDYLERRKSTPQSRVLDAHGYCESDGTYYEGPAHMWKITNTYDGEQLAQEDGVDHPTAFWNTFLCATKQHAVIAKATYHYKGGA